MARNKHQAARKQGGFNPQAAAAATAKNIPALYGEALQHFNAGRLPEAEQLCRKILAMNHYHTDSLHMLGVLSRHAGNRLEAVELIGKAIRIKGDAPYYHNSLGNILKELGRHDEAITCYRRALALAPNHAEPHNNLGGVYMEQGQYDDAIACFQRALAINPDYPEAHLNFGRAFSEQRKFSEALACFQRALAIKPDYADAYFNRGITLKMSGDEGGAFQAFRKATSLDPRNNEYWVHAAKTLASLVFMAADDSLFRDLLHILEQPIVSAGVVRHPILSALRHHPVIAGLLKQSAPGDQAAQIVYGEVAAQLSAIPLLVLLISLISVVTPEAEAMLTQLRRALLQTVAAGENEVKGLPFTAALTLQCFTNEYVFNETADETTAVERLQEKLATLIENGRAVPPVWLAALAAYRPLNSFPWAGKLLAGDWPDEIRAIVTQQVTEPQEEQALLASLPRLTSVEDETSRAVRAQYEENPYPRWTRARLEPVSQPVKKVMQGICPHRDWSAYQFPDEPEILIAGTGTGEHALTVSTRFADAHLLAVDLSLSSLAYAVRKTRGLGIANIDYAQADILELDRLDRQFDIIDSTGVLHHLKDPMAGWRILVKLLRPGGLMRIGLYSEAARRPVVKARALIAEKEYAPTAKDIRRCRQDILYGTSDPALKEVSKFWDFYSLSECRDLIFHVQEHRFTPPRIEAALRELDLEFLGFELANMDAIRRFTGTNLDPEALSSLPLWDAFEQENPTTFRGMYQFWCYKRQT